MMKAVLSSCVLAAVAIFAAGAPTTILETTSQKKGIPQESLRLKRSNYAQQYATPCAAASAPIPAFAAAPYQLSLAPVHHQTFQAPPQAFGYYGYPQYRTDMAEDEMLDFSEFEPMYEHQFARYAYPAPAAAHFSGQQSSAGGAVFSVFPNAPADTGSVALLLSCSPSITTGHVVKTQPAAAIAASSAVYREDEPSQAFNNEEQHETAPLTSDNNAQQT